MAASTSPVSMCSWRRRDRTRAGRRPAAAAVVRTLIARRAARRVARSGGGEERQRLGVVLDLAAERHEDRLVRLDRADDVLAGDVGRGDDARPSTSRSRGPARARRTARARRSSGSSRRTRRPARRCRPRTCAAPVSLAGPSRRGGGRPRARPGAVVPGGTTSAPGGSVRDVMWAGDPPRLGAYHRGREGSRRRGASSAPHRTGPHRMVPARCDGSPPNRPGGRAGNRVLIERGRPYSRGCLGPIIIRSHRRTMDTVSGHAHRHPRGGPRRGCPGRRHRPRVDAIQAPAAATRPASTAVAASAAGRPNGSLGSNGRQRESSAMARTARRP